MRHICPHISMVYGCSHATLQGWVAATVELYGLLNQKMFTVWFFRENFLVLLHVNHSRALQVGCYHSQLLAPLDPQSHYPQYVWGMELNYLTPKLIILWPNAHRTKSQFPSMEQTHPTLPSCKSLRPMALNSLLVSKHSLHVCMYWDLCALELWCWRRLLRAPWTASRSNHLILKEINHAYSLEELMLKLQYFGHLRWSAGSLEKTLILGNIEGKRKRGQQSMRWLDGTTESMDMSLSKLQEIVEDRGAWRATVHGIAKNWTWLSDRRRRWDLCEWHTLFTKSLVLLPKSWCILCIYIYIFFFLIFFGCEPFLKSLLNLLYLLKYHFYFIWFVLFLLWGMWDLSSSSRDRTRTHTPQHWEAKS